MWKQLKAQIKWCGWRAWDFLRDKWMGCKWGFQRLFRGWADRDLWNLDYTIAEWVLPRLKAFRNRTVGCPCEFKDPSQWDEILDKMIWSFNYIANFDDIEDQFYEDAKGDNSKYMENLLEGSEKCQEGLELFAKYFRNLWD